MAEPRNPFAKLTGDQLDRALAELGASLRFPPTPDLASLVRERITAESASAPPAPLRFPVKRILAAAAIVVLALVAALAVSSGFRSAVADLFGVRGVHIEFVRETPTPVTTMTPTATSTLPASATPVASPTAMPVGPSLLLGRAVTLEEAQAQVPYAIHVPTLPGLGAPDEVYLRTLPDGNHMVSLLYLPAQGLPETDETGVAVLLMQFEARDEVNYIGKTVGDGNAWLFVDVGGNDALWIQGTHQLTLLPDPSAGCCRESTRTSGSVLLWEQDGLTFRLESSLTSEEAIAIGESLVVPTATPAASPTGN